MFEFKKSKQRTIFFKDCGCQHDDDEFFENKLMRNTIILNYQRERQNFRLDMIFICLLIIH